MDKSHLWTIFSFHVNPPVETRNLIWWPTISFHPELSHLLLPPRNIYLPFHGKTCCLTSEERRNSLENTKELFIVISEAISSPASVAVGKSALFRISFLCRRSCISYPIQFFSSLHISTMIHFSMQMITSNLQEPNPGLFLHISTMIHFSLAFQCRW